MGVFLNNGYLNIDYILGSQMPFVFVVGGRGTGKTFGALQYAYREKQKFLLIRRTQSQVDLINKPEFSPFKALNDSLDISVGVKPLSKYHSGFYEMEERDGKEYPAGAPIGYTAALSTFSNLRGFDASDVELIIFDEFIPEKHERPIRNEGAALLNVYETVNRNRELKGEKPVRMLCLANANDLGNPIFMELQLISKAERMRQKKQTVSIMQDRGIALFMITGSPISEAKKETALYKLTAGSEFSEMAIENEFAEMKSKSIKAQPLAEYKPLVSVGELCIYKHKIMHKFYCTTTLSGSPPRFEASETEIQRFCRAFRYLYDEYMQDNIYFENVTCEIILAKYFG